MKELEERRDIGRRKSRIIRAIPYEGTGRTKRYRKEEE
jgi:hypothetical protein